jgi:hypothetical protein
VVLLKTTTHQNQFLQNNNKSFRNKKNNKGYSLMYPLMYSLMYSLMYP